MPSVVLYDTTLRDGSQRAGISFSVADKVRIVRALDEFGMHYIEGGWPGSNPKDGEFFRAMQGVALQRARLVAFSSTRRANVRCADDSILQALLDAATPVVCVVGKSWDFHVTGALGTTLEENLNMIRDTMAYLKAQGRETVYDAEHFFDGWKANRDYALATLRAAAGGADWVTLCDTNGGTLPHELAAIVATVHQALPEVRLGIHTHDDAGVGVANSLAAIQAGCTMVQGTVNGYGERCGNANLVAVIPNLQLKLGIPVVPEDKLQELTNLSYFVSELANLAPWDAQPFVGRNAFAHKAGIHVSAVLKHSTMYEHVPPESVGNARRVLVSELSGKSNLQYAFGGQELTDAQVKALLDRIKGLEYEGYQFEGAEASLELLVREQRGQAPAFRLESYRVTLEHRPGRDPHAECTIKVKVGDRTVHTAADGNGPVNALDAALRKALGEVFPGITRVRLMDYKVRVLEGADGTGAKVRVLVESSDGRHTWGTVGVSTNIIEASWLALADSLAYHLAREADPARLAGD